MIKFLNILSICILPFIISVILIWAMIKKIPAYEVFTEGAKEGFNTAVRIIPYIVAIMVAVGMLRASGFMDILGNLLKVPLGYLKIPVDVLPLMVTRSLSGGATIGVFSDIVANNGANSYASKLAGVIVGSSETTFYVLAVYFGSVGIKKFRHAVITGVLADVIGIILAVIICRFMF